MYLWVVDELEMILRFAGMKTDRVEQNYCEKYLASATFSAHMPHEVRTGW